MKKRRVMQELGQNPLQQGEDFKRVLKQKFNHKQKVKSTMLDRDGQEFLDALEGNLEKCDIELEMQQKLLKVEDAKVKDQEQKVIDIEGQLWEERQKLKEDKKSFMNRSQKKLNAEKNRFVAAKKLAEFKRMQIEFGRTILLHGSATKKQMLAYANGKIISTNRDKKPLKEAGIVIDETFKPSEAEHLIEYIPTGFKEKYEPVEWKSILDYCEMVANLKMAAKPGEEENIILLYSNPDIAEILKANGLEWH